MPQPVHIAQMPSGHKTLPIDKLRSTGVIRNDLPATAMVARQIANQVGGAGGDAYGKIEGAVIMFQKGIQHPGGKDAAHGTAFYYQCTLRHDAFSR